MELNEFVASSLTEILTAVIKAQRFATEHNMQAEIAPAYDEPHTAKVGEMFKTYDNGTQSRIIDVNFDVAVTASDEQAAKAGAGIKVVGIALSLGASAEKSVTTSAASRISFAIPIILPPHDQVKVTRIPVEKKLDLWPST